jgi:hypothetical protein
METPEQTMKRYKNSKMPVPNFWIRFGGLVGVTAGILTILFVLLLALFGILWVVKQILLL